MPLKGKYVRVRGPWWHYQFSIAGEVYSGSTGLAGDASNQSRAEQIAERKRQEVLSPRPEAVGVRSTETAEAKRRKPFDVAAAEFGDWARDVEYRMKPNSAARLRTSMVACVAFFGARPVSEIGAAAIEDFKSFRIEQHGVRDITLRHDLHALSVFYRKYAMKRGYASRNPLGRGPDGVREVSIPSDRDAIREHVVTPEEEASYLRAALALHAQYVKSRPLSERARALPNLHDLAVLMLEQGARPEELLAVAKADVDLENATLRIAGGKSRAARRLLNLTPRSGAVLRPRLASPGPWLFPSDRRPGQHVTKLQCTHDRVCREAKVCFVIYDLRHTFATRMIDAGVNAPIVAAIMGHSGLRTIYRYIHPTADAQKQAMERYEAAQRRGRMALT